MGTQLMIGVVICVCVVSIVAVAVSAIQRRRAELRHWTLLSALLCAVCSPVLVAGFSLAGFSLIELPLVDSAAASDAAEGGQIGDKLKAAENVAANVIKPAFKFDPQASASSKTAKQPTKTGEDTSLGIKKEEVAMEESVPSIASAEPNSLTETSETIVLHRAKPVTEGMRRIFLLWLTGVVVLAAGSVVSRSRLKQILRSLEPAVGIEAAINDTKVALNLDRLPRIAFSGHVRAPFVTGWLRPVMVLPRSSVASLSAMQLADILIHETAHVIRRDQLVVWLQAAARCLYWPLVPIHFLNRQLGRAREEVCDNYVLNRRDGLSYAATLLHMAELSRGAVPLAAGMGILHWRGELEDRIAGLINRSENGTTQPRRLTTLVVFSCFLLITVALCGTTIVAALPNVAATDEPSPAAAPKDRDNADSQNSKAPVPLIFGTVQTPTGEIIVGADVLLTGFQDNDIVVFGRTKSDNNGRFAFNDLLESDVFRNPYLLTLWAEHPEFGLGWSTQVYNCKRRTLAIQIRPVVNFEGRLLDADERPISDARIETMSLGTGRFNERNRDEGRLSPDQRAIRSVVTDEQGGFRISNVAARGWIMMQVKSTGHGEFQISSEVGTKLTVKLKRTGSLSGSLTWSEGIEMPATGDLGKLLFQTGLTFDENGSDTGFQNATCLVLFTQEVNITNDGRIEAERLPTGNYFAQTTILPHVPLIAPASAKFTIEPDQLNNLPLKADRAQRISGRVVGLLDDKPVPNATVQVFQVIDSSLHYGPKLTTNADGEYVAHGLPGKYLLKVTEAPEQYVPLDASTGYHGDGEAKLRMPTLELTEDRVWPDLQLDPAGDVILEVVDEQGDAVPEAIVSVVTPAGYPDQKDYSTEKKADADGRYVIRQVALNDTLSIRVRAKIGISDPKLIVTPGELSGPVRVVLSEKNGFRIPCRVLDEDGQSIAGARVLIGTHIPYVTKWFSGIAVPGDSDSAITDADGFATVGPMWSDLSWRISVSAEGYGNAETQQRSGSAEAVIEQNTFTLLKAQLPIAGFVRDANGQPLQGVRAFSEGRDYRNASAISDSSGAFQLENVAPDVRYVFADIAGYRLGGTRVSPGQTTADIVVRTNDSPPLGIRAMRRPPRANQFERAGELIEQAWALPMDPRITSRIAPLESMVRIDPAFALTMSQSAGGGFDYVVRCATAEQAIENDPDYALELLQQTKNWKGFATAMSLGQKLARSPNAKDREIAVRLARLAEEIGTTVDPPRYNPAPLLALLGEHDKAKDLIERGLKNPQQIAPAVVGTLATYDYDKAKSIAAAFEKDYMRTESIVQIAMATLSYNLDRSIAEIESLKTESGTQRTRDQLRLKIALAIVDTDMKRAIELVQQCEETDNRAQALGYLAVAVGKQDKPQAWKLIDQVLEIHRSSQDAFQSWTNYGGGGPFAAALAWQARQLEYPDMESVIWHVRLACRTKGDTTSAQQRLSSAIATARILALTDQFAARELLTMIDDKVTSIPRGEGGVSLYDQWLQAWLLVDFNEGARLLQEDLDRLAREGKENPLRYGHGSVFRLLTATDDELFSLIIRDETGLWDLEKEY